MSILSDRNHRSDNFQISPLDIYYNYNSWIVDYDPSERHANWVWNTFESLFKRYPFMDVEFELLPLAIYEAMTSLNLIPKRIAWVALGDSVATGYHYVIDKFNNIHILCIVEDSSLYDAVISTIIEDNP